MREDARRLRSLIEGALETVPDRDDVGLFLSGGLDSSALACILLSRGRRVRSVTTRVWGHPECDETKYVEMIKKAYPRLETNYVDILHVSLLKELREWVGITRRTATSGSFVAEHLLMKEARRLGMTTVVSGYLADTLMGGNPVHLLDKARDDLLRVRVCDGMANIRRFSQDAKLSGSDRVPLRIAKRLVLSKGLKPALRGSRSHSVDVAEELARANGLSLVVPFGDTRIKDFCAVLPPDRLVLKGETKVILKEAIGDIVPADIVNRRVPFGFYGADSVWLLENRASVEALGDRALAREYSRFLRHPEWRWHKGLWMRLSSLCRGSCL